MNTYFKHAVFLLIVVLTSCNKENKPQIAYKYEKQPATITCENVNSELYKEALYSFEDDILNFYRKTRPNTNLSQAYSQFIRLAILERVKYENIISKHTLDVFHALKNENTLWNANNPKSYIDYNGPEIACISENIENKNLKTTMAALLKTNSMEPKLFGAPLTANYREVIKDKYLATYVALDLFYAKLFKIDFSKVNLDKPEAKVDFNKVPKSTVKTQKLNTPNSTNN